MQNLIQKAIIKSQTLHAGHFRKGQEKIPYFVHPMQVSLILSYYTQDQDYLAAALLHDVVEECDYSIDNIFNEFGEEVGDLVNYLTEDKTIADWFVRKDQYVEILARNDIAMIIKAADCLANMDDLINLLKAEGKTAMTYFQVPLAYKLLYFSNISDKIIAIAPRQMLVNYTEKLKDLQHIASNYFEETFLLDMSGLRQ